MALSRVRLYALIGFLALASWAFAQEYHATTAGDSNIPLNILDVKLVPLTVDELRAEALAWQDNLQNTVAEIGRIEITVLSANEKDPATINEQDDAAHTAAMNSLRDLTQERDDDIQRLNLVLDHITKKTGLTEANLEPEDVLAMRRYIESVNGIRTDVVDLRTLAEALIDWLLSEDGGIKVLKNISILLGTVFGFWILGKIVARGVNKGMEMTGKTSRMMREFVFRNLPKAAVAFGILFGLAILDVNITPLLAMIGGASFVIAFALQDSLSNFASGIMIMLYKPFDVDDFVDVATIQGTVKSMTLVSTTISTIDNKVIIVPNNSIWGNVITNFTGVNLRRVDLLFGIGYEDDMDKAEEILRDVATNHPRTLSEPKPIIKMHELGDSSVNFICRPWVKTEDYWDVYWDLMRSVKERFDAEGVSIPFPQTDVHLYTADHRGNGDSDR